MRPPSPINVAVKIGDERLAVSPARFGAGPITIIASNQSSAAHRLTVDGPRLRQASGPINPLDTATLQVTTSPGELTVSVDGSSSISPAKVQVGPKRPSGQGDLQLP